MGVLIIGILLFRVLYWDPLFSETSHIETLPSGLRPREAT